MYLHWSVITAFCFIDGSSYVTDSVRLATSEAAVFGSGLRERLRAPHVSPPALGLTTLRDTNTFFPVVFQTAAGDNSTFQGGTSPLHGATSHSARTGCSLSHDRDQPITAECVEHRGWRLLLTSLRRRRLSKNSFKYFLNKKLNSTSYTQ